MHYTILQGNVERRIDELPENSVHVVVTSPPYYGLRDYGTGTWEGGDPDCKHFRSNKSISAITGHRAIRDAGFGAGDAIYKSVCAICGATRVDDQIGLEPTPELYVERLVGVFSKLRRVLREDGVMFLNIGDSYWGSGGDSFKNIENGQRGSLTSGIDTRPLGVSPMESLSTKKHPFLKPKDLIGIPWMLAFALRNNGAASPAHMRDVEEMIHAVTKSYDTREEWPDKIAALVERLEREHVDANKGGWYLRSEIIWGKNNPMPESVKDRPTKAHEQIFLLTKSKDYFYDYLAIAEPVAESTVVRAKSVNSATSRKDGGEASNQGGLTPEQQDRYYANLPAVRNKRSIWMINTQGYPGAHFATFPMELPEVCIRAGSSERGACVKCGAPWERVTKSAKSDRDGDTATAYDSKSTAGRLAKLRQAARESGEEYQTRIETVGWKPTCACDAPTVPAVVMDPFCGAGTTGEVALRLGRSFIGIELSQKYIDDHIKPRLDAINPLFNTGEYK